MERHLISSSTPWEATVGYSRAVRVGNLIEVAGTTAVEGNDIVGQGDAYAQAAFIFRKIQHALEQAGGGMGDIVRTRMYVTASFVIDDVLRAHGEVFRDIRPVATIVVVSGLIDQRLLVEIEATAVVV